MYIFTPIFGSMAYSSMSTFNSTVALYPKTSNTAFVYSFNLNSGQTFDYTKIPIYQPDGTLTYTYTQTVVGTLYTITVNYTFTDNGTTNSGLSVGYTNVNGWYNSSTTNFTISKFGKLPLSRGGSQFYYLNNLSFTATDSPTILSNTSANAMFQFCSNFNGNIGSWNTANVTNMGAMFFLCSAFNQNIGSWNTANVTNMGAMFFGCSAFNQNIGSWNTANVTNMSNMLSSCTNFNNGDVSGGTSKRMYWNVAYFGGITPSGFSLYSALTLAPTGNSPFTSTG
jgi:surface protein